jgi:recombination protein RecT
MAEMFQKVMPRVRAAIPQHVKPERLFQVAYLALSRQPALLECTAISVLRAVIIGAQLGLDISGIGGMAYLVPFRNNRTGEREVQFIIGYRGMIELARRSGDIAWIYPGIVYANERFDYQINPIPRLQHEPNLDEKTRGEMIGCYAIAVFRDPTVPPMPWAMTKAQVDKIRARSKAGNDGPWVTNYPEMMMKTAIRGLSKYIPASAELNQALDYEDQVESGHSLVIAGEMPDMGEGAPLEAPAEGRGAPAPAPVKNAMGGTAAIARKLEGKA